MSRHIQLVLLCEDRQHEVFARRFLVGAGWTSRNLRIVISPPGKNSAEQFVRTRFPQELTEYRRNRNRVSRGLIVIQDGDNLGTDARIQQLDDACVAAGVEQRSTDEQVAIMVPTWNIETWIEYLRGADVDEGKKDYQRLSQERDCQVQVDVLLSMCSNNELRNPAPASLSSACHEFRRVNPR